jgi:hypothetical protein
MSSFKMSDLGGATYYLGTEIVQSFQSLWDVKLYAPYCPHESENKATKGNWNPTN